jgi:S-formylglutathione hydrolase FrmB
MRLYQKIFLVLALIALGSCGDPASPKATVSVFHGMDIDGITMNDPVEGAIVTAYVGPQNGKPGYVDPDNKVEELVAETSASGQCSFDFPVENILQVKAEFAFSGDTLYGEGVLVLKEDETVTETIHLRKWKSQL